MEIAPVGFHCVQERPLAQADLRQGKRLNFPGYLLPAAPLRAFGDVVGTAYWAGLAAPTPGIRAAPAAVVAIQINSRRVTRSRSAMHFTSGAGDNITARTQLSSLVRRYERKMRKHIYRSRDPIRLRPIVQCSAGLGPALEPHS